MNICPNCGVPRYEFKIVEDKLHPIVIEQEACFGRSSNYVHCLKQNRYIPCCFVINSSEGETCYRRLACAISDTIHKEAADLRLVCLLLAYKKFR